MSLRPDSTLGPYSVTAKIGEGGMGEVYRARDTKLDRDVALKVLPQAFIDDPDRLARFEREAKVLASLNHPNIGGIYGLEESEGVKALVLEYIEGPTLADRIKQGPIPVDDALPIAKQIAEALEAAHEQGIIHRDLKPANIKLRPDGTVKVLDFGLAKALDTTPEGDPNQSPTLTAAATQMGVIMGTAAYMSPEQARGDAVDARSDIWSLGVVLFEMLAGGRLFEGKSVAQVLAQVLERPIDLSTLPSSTPRLVRRLISRCLERDDRRRLRDGHPAVLLLEEVEAAPSLDEPPSTRTDGARTRSRRRILPAVAAAVAASTVVGLTTWLLLRPAPASTPSATRFGIAVPPTGHLSIALNSPDIAVSSDGRRVAYFTGSGGADLFGPRTLYVRSLDQLNAVPLVEASALGHPFFSPDGRWVGFYDTRALELRRVRVEGGPVVPICAMDGFMWGASWGDDGTIVFATNTGLWRVAASGGEPQRLTTPAAVIAGEGMHYWPVVLPDSRAVLFTVKARPIEDSSIAALSLETGEWKVVLQGGSFARYAASGHLVYGLRNTLWAVGFDPVRLEMVGAPTEVATGVMTKSLNGAANFDLTETGSMVYVPAVADTRPERTLVWVDRRGREEALPVSPRLYESPRISPDGRRVVLGVMDPENLDLIVYDLARDTPMRLTVDPGEDRYPIWSPDGRQVLFQSTRDGARNLYSIAADGTGQTERMTTSELVQWPYAWSADGETLVIGSTATDAVRDIDLLGPDTQTGAEGLIATAFVEMHAEISPNGEWIAYSSNESGQMEVYVRPFPNVDDGRWQVSRDGGWSPVWAPDGRELFFRTAGAWDMMVVAVDTEPTFSVGNAERLFNAGDPYLLDGLGRTRPWDLATDGRFLMIKEGGSEGGRGDQPDIVYVQHWFQELLERRPVD